MRIIKHSFRALALVLVLSIISLNVKAQTNNALFFYGNAGDVNVVELYRTIQDDFTIEFWMNTKQNFISTDTLWYNGSEILGADDGDNNETGGFGISLLGSKIGFGVGNTLQSTIISTSDVNTGQWVHVAATRNKTTGLVQLFINGVLENSRIIQNFNSLTVPNTIYLGGWIFGSYKTVFNGAIDELRLWNTERTVQEINNNKNIELTDTPVGLVNYYNFNEGVANGNNVALDSLIDIVGTNTRHLAHFKLTGLYSNWVNGFGSVVNWPTRFNWTGAVSNDWTDAFNWDLDPNVNPLNIPFYIPAGLVNEPIVPDNNSIYVYNCINDGSITLGVNSGLNIPSNYSGNGVIVGNDSVAVGSNGCQIIISNEQYNPLINNIVSLKFDQITRGGNAIGALSVTNNVIVNIENHLDILSDLTLNPFQYYMSLPLILTLNTNNNLTLKSTLNNTASLDYIQDANTINNNNDNNNKIIINGNVTVERYIPKGQRAYRDLSAGGISGADFYNSWQESGTKKSGYGIYITGKAGTTTGVDATTGLDYSATGNPSLYSYTNSIWGAITQTKANIIDPYKGYRVLVRGDRNMNNFGFSADPVTMTKATVIRTTGNLVMGDVTYTTTGVTNDNAISNGQYNSNYKLQSGQDAFNLVANPYASVIDWLQIVPSINGNSSSNSTDISNSYWYFDPTFFNNGYATYVTYNSITGSSNPTGSNISQYIQPGQSFFIQNNSTNDPVLSFTESNKVANYNNTNNNGIFGNTVTPNRLKISLWKSINGTTANIDASVAAFNTSFTKAISAEDSKKMTNAGENISITEGSNDLSIEGLPIPAITDAIALKLTQLIANTTYQLNVDISKFTTTGLEAYIHDNETNKDVLANAGTTFTATNNIYANRFSIIFKADKVVVATINKGTAVYPNPVTGNTFNLQMNNLDKGIYEAVIYNSLGQEVMATTFNHTGRSSIETIAIKKLAVGVYTLQVSGNGEKYNTDLIISK